MVAVKSKEMSIMAVGYEFSGEVRDEVGECFSDEEDIIIEGFNA